MADDRGYIALHRSTLQHYLFKDERPFTRFQAWVWLITKAAWRPCQRRVGRRIATLDRGQLATTVRSLGTSWGWHPSRVWRFIDLLKRESMVRTLIPDAVAETVTETPSQGLLTVITICNYSKFNNSSTLVKRVPKQYPEQYPKRRGQQELDLPHENQPEESNHITKSKRDSRVGDKSGEKAPARQYATKPRNGQVSKKHGTVYIHKSDEWTWKVHADDYKKVRGADPLPDRYGGRWFKLNGEGETPLPKRIFG